MRAATHAAIENAAPMRKRSGSSAGPELISFSACEAVSATQFRQFLVSRGNGD
jgi:hypothetical protein